MYVLDHSWLLVLLPLPAVIWWLLPAYREQSAAVRIPFFKDITAAAGIGATEGSVVPKSNFGQKLIAPICWGLIVLALARPQYIEPPIEKTEPQRDLMLAIDLSQSMDTRDFHDPAGNLQARVDAVHTVVADFIDKRPEDRLGLIAFGDAPYPLVPFTLDHKTVKAMLADSLPGMAGPRTAIGDAIGLAIKMFDQSTAPDKVLILLTDGNDTASKMPPDKAAGIAAEKHIVIHTVGIGDPNAQGEQKLDTVSLATDRDGDAWTIFLRPGPGLAAEYLRASRSVDAGKPKDPVLAAAHRTVPLSAGRGVDPRPRLSRDHVAAVGPRRPASRKGGGSMITDFHFLRPLWLLALLAAPLLVMLIGRRTDVRSQWQNMIAPHLLDHLLIEKGGRRWLQPVHLTAVLIVDCRDRGGRTDMAA